MKRHNLQDFDFESRIEIAENGCWNWTKGLTARGYGKLSFSGKDATAHRIAWLKYRGSIPEGMLVCHHCDNPRCVNPDHLFIGTSMDNNHDMIKKDRHCHGDEHWTKTNPEKLKIGDEHPLRKNPALAARGDRHGLHAHPEKAARGIKSGAYTQPESRRIGIKNGRAILTDEKVIEIRRRRICGETTIALAKEFGVKQTTVSGICLGKIWMSIPMPYSSEKEVPCQT